MFILFMYLYIKYVQLNEQELRVFIITLIFNLILFIYLSLFINYIS